MATFHKLLGENYDAHQVFSHHSSRESGPFGDLGRHIHLFRRTARDHEENKGKVVTIPKTAKPMEIQAFHN
jgi:hypothetical protein